MITNTVVWSFESVIHFSVSLVEINQHQMADYARLNHVLCGNIYFGRFDILFSTVKEPRWKTYKCFHYSISHYRTLEWRHVSDGWEVVRTHSSCETNTFRGPIRESAALNKGRIFSQPKYNLYKTLFEWIQPIAMFFVFCFCFFLTGVQSSGMSCMKSSCAKTFAITLRDPCISHPVVDPIGAI